MCVCGGRRWAKVGEGGRGWAAVGGGGRRWAAVGGGGRRRAHLGLLPLDDRGEHVLAHEARAVLLGPHVAQVLGLLTHARLLAGMGVRGWWGEGG